MSITQSRGFTLVEMLVVVSIIGLLAATVVSSLGQAREEAQYAVARAQIRQFANLINTARSESGQTFMDMTGLIASDLRCRPSHGGGMTDTRCITQYNTTLGILNDEANGLYEIAGSPRDPWNSPYLLNENEGENYGGGTCAMDIVGSAGPDRVPYTTDDIIYNIPDTLCVPPSSGYIEHHENVNWDE